MAANLTMTSATWRIPVAVMAASASAIVTWTLAFIVAALDASIQVTIVAASIGTVAGCSILAAIVVVSSRNATKRSHDLLYRKHAKKMADLANEVDSSVSTLRGDLVREFEKMRATQYALSVGSSAQPPTGTDAVARPLRPVK